MSSKISALTSLPSVTASDYLVIARTSDSENYKHPLQSVFATLSNIGYDSPVYLIDAVTSTNAINQRGLKSNSSILTLEVTTSGATKNVLFDIDESAIDLSLCDNSTSAFLTSVDLSTGTGTVAVANGGTGLTTLADNAVLLTQSSGNDAVVPTEMTTNGELLIGGTSGIALSTLTAGDNITITNGDGSIEIASSFSVADSDLDFAGYSVDMNAGWISGDGGNDGGLTFNGTNKAYIGTSANQFTPTYDLGVGTGITFKNNGTRYIRIEDGSTTAPLNISGQNAESGSSANGGNVRIYGGAGESSGNGGSVIIYGGTSTSGNPGAISMFVDGSESLTVESTKDVNVVNGNLTVSGSGKGFILPTENILQTTSLSTSVTTTQMSGYITLTGASLAAGASATFTFANNNIISTSRLFFTVESSISEAAVDSFIVVQVQNVLNGLCQVKLFNAGSENSTTNSHTLHYLIIK